MKKIFIYALALASLTTVKVSAQKGFSVSVKAIPQFSFLQNKDDRNNESYNAKATFNAAFGAGAGYNVSKNAGIGADVLYSLQGQKYTLAGKAYNQKNEYLKVPVYFSYNTDASKPISFIGKIGPQVSFITSSKLDDNNGHSIINNTKDRYDLATFGGMALAGAQFRLQSNLYVSTALRFDYDFTNAEDNTSYGYTPGRANTYNSAAGVEVGLKYMLK